MSKPTEKPAETTTEATEILWNYYKALSEPDNGKGFAISWFYTGKENEKDKPEPAGFKKWDSLNELTKAFLADDVALKKLKDAVEAADKINDDKIEEYCKLYNKKNSPEPNDSQKEAIRLAINNPITIVQGPPGTGKTETIKNLLICLRKHNEEAKIAMVSSNNHAVENLEEKIKECDCLKDKYARLGAKDLRQKFADNHPDYEKDDKLRFNSKLLDKFPIILSTIHSLRKCVNFDNQFDHVIVDECSQVSTRLGLLAMASAKHLVLFGDEKQLSPIHNDDLTKQVKDVDVIEEFIGEYYLDIGDNSFMHACSERFGDTAAKIMLNEHYRCHPKIIDFCNQIFYGGDLKIKTQGKGFPIRIRWYEGDYWERIYENKDEQNSSQDSTSDYKSSNYNMKQIEIFVEEELPLIIRKYNEAKKNNSEYSMCVLSPYKDQIKKLKEKLSDGETLKNLCEKIGLPTDELNELLNGKNKSDKNESNEDKSDEVNELLNGENKSDKNESNEVWDLPSWSLPIPSSSTVHKAQGKEYDYVCVMPVVDDTSKTWHQSARITNVAISRAKEELCYIMSANWMPKVTQEEIMDKCTKEMLYGCTKSLYDGIKPIIQDPPNYEEQTGKEQEIGYLPKLVDYVIQNKDKWKGSDYGLIRTEIHSIFDIDYILRKTFGKKYNNMSAPELSLCGILDNEIEKGKEKNDGPLKDIFLHYNMRLGDKDGDSNVKGMKVYDDVKEYIKDAHFDVVLTRGDDDDGNNGKIALIIEVDGAEHRGVTDFVRNSDGDKSNDRESNDGRKDKLVKTIGENEDFYKWRFLRLPTDGTTRDEIKKIIDKIEKADTKTKKVIQPKFEEGQQFNEKKKTLYCLIKKVFDLLDDKLENVCKEFLNNEIIKAFQEDNLEDAFGYLKFLEENGISLNFDVKGNSMDYTDELTCQQYMLRYAMAYAFEYYVMYRIALKQLGESPRVYSFGCGSGLDCVSLAYAKLKLNYDEKVSYRGIDLTEWAENFDLNDLPGVDAEKRVDKNEGMLAFLEKEPDYMPNILFFPKILSEIDKDKVIKPFCELLKKLNSDKLIVCVSYRGRNTSDDDLEKTNLIIKALEGEGNYKPQPLVDLDDIKKEIQLKTDEDNVFKFNYADKEYSTIDENFSIPGEVYRYVGAGIKDICAKTVNEKDRDKKDDICNDCDYKALCEEQCPKSAMIYVDDMCFQIIRLEKKSDK